MKKIIILSLITILCVGCEVKDYEIDEVNDREFSVFIDETTCVEYLYDNYMKKGGMTVRYNQDGTIKINKDCLKENKQ